MVLKAWELAQKTADELPPYLADNDLTAERFYQKNKDKMNKKEAVNILDKLVEEGKLEKQERRHKGKSGTRPVVYVVVDGKNRS